MSSYPLIIQGGMGIAVSNYHLAKAVSMAGQLGVVSGTAIDAVMAMRLHYGDILGNVRRSLNNFPVKEIGQQMVDKFYNANNKIKQMFKFTMPSLNMSHEKENSHHHSDGHDRVHFGDDVRRLLAERRGVLHRDQRRR